MWDLFRASLRYATGAAIAKTHLLLIRTHAVGDVHADPTIADKTAG